VTIRIPGYKIERLLAEGGMASVYLATQESLGRLVILKLLRKFDDPGQLTRFLNEGRIIASLNHRNIITIYDLGIVDGERPFISMEFLEGGDLEERIAKGIDKEDAFRLLETIGDCLDFVHKKGIIHRDIKPANILFHKDGTPILSDFGVAKQEQTDAKLTMDGAALGSPYYLSPEQAECKKLDGRTDIYGLGIVLYEMLIGTKPYEGNSPIETIVSHLSDPLPTLPPELSDYQALIAKMIAKSPDDRFPSAGEMVRYVQRLRNSRDGSHAESRDEQHSTSQSKFGIVRSFRIWMSGRKLLWVSAGISATLLAIASATLVMRQPDKADPIQVSENLVANVYESASEKDSERPLNVFENEPIEVQEGSADSDTVPLEEPANTPESQLPEPKPPVMKRPAPADTHSQLIEDLFSSASSARKAYRLTTPRDDNALEYYRKVLELDPWNENAIEGINEIVETYADLAEREIDRFKYKKAREYLHRGLSIHPDDPRLIELEKKANIFRDVPARTLGKFKSLFKQHDDQGEFHQ